MVFDLEHLAEQLEEWLRDPKQLMHLDPELRALLESIGIDELRRQLLERLEEQKKRHEGGNRWVGTGGTSPFGQGGMHPSGVRIGGSGGGRSALAVADARRFRELRKDMVLDTRQMGMALRRLRRWAPPCPPLATATLPAAVASAACRPATTAWARCLPSTV